MAGSLITVHLAELQYSGDGIGDDLTVVVDVGIGRIELNKKMSSGDRSTINKEIVQFWSNSEAVELSALVRVIERDPVYNEAGQSEISLRIEGGQAGSAESSVSIAVAESGDRSNLGSAQFLVAIRTTTVASTRYVASSDDGWLAVILEDTRARISLPEALQVEVTRIASGREYFNIREDAYRGRLASVKLNPDGTSRLSAIDPRAPPATATYSLSKKELRIGSTRYTATDDPLSLLSRGRYDIEIPDAPHRGGLRYPQATRLRTWFRIGHSGDRYIHTGRASAGCITIVEVNRWDGLASLLVTSRKGDGISVGTLEVIP